METVIVSATHCEMKSSYVVACLAAVVALCFASSAAAEPSGEYALFKRCPYDNPEVVRCLHASIDGGEVVLGSRRVPVVNEVVLQGGVGTPKASDSASGKVNADSPMVPARDAVTLSEVPQPVPGGLLGVSAPGDVSPLVDAAIAVLFENELLGVSATLELARPASEVLVNENHVAEQLGVGLKVPVKVHLESPLLGGSCYVGSTSSPIWWELTTGKIPAQPPSPALQGTSGELLLLAEGTVSSLKGSVFVDNAWSAPRARGCGGVFSSLLDPVVDEALGLPAAVGRNSTVLRGTVSQATALALKQQEEQEDGE